MKKKTLLYILAILLVQISKAQSSDTIFITDFGVKPYSYENSVTQIQAAIEACKQKGAKVLSFEGTIYGRKAPCEKNIIFQTHLQKVNALQRLKRWGYYSRIYRT